MKKIFVDFIIQDVGAIIEITGDDYIHLARSLRVKIGDRFIVGDLSNNEYNGVITSITKNSLNISLKSMYDRNTVKLFKTVLYFPILKGDRTEFILQKCSETGIDVFIPLITENTIVQLEDRSENKYKRWNTIIKEAAMQCGRKNLPVLEKAVKLENIPDIDTNNQYGLIGSIEGDHFSLLSDTIKNKKSVCMVVGPEGDFTESELNTLIKKHFTPVNLSDNILRSETACIFFSSIISIYNHEVKNDKT